MEVRGDFEVALVEVLREETGEVLKGYRGDSESILGDVLRVNWGAVL